MRLNDALVTSFIYEGTEYDIDMSFDVILDVYDVLKDKYLRGYEKAEIALELLLDKTFKGLEAIELWNYIHDNLISQEGKEYVEYDLEGNPMPTRKNSDNPVISFNQDAQQIYASFRQAYNINLFDEQGKMHWYEFQSLLAGLPDNTSIQKIIEIRSWKPSEGESKEYRKHMRNLQKIHEIKEVD